jgi:hypothetical protein
LRAIYPTKQKIYLTYFWPIHSVIEQACGRGAAWIPGANIVAGFANSTLASLHRYNYGRANPATTSIPRAGPTQPNTL